MAGRDGSGRSALRSRSRRMAALRHSRTLLDTIGAKYVTRCPHGSNQLRRRRIALDTPEQTMYPDAHGCRGCFPVGQHALCDGFPREYASGSSREQIQHGVLGLCKRDRLPSKRKTARREVQLEAVEPKQRPDDGLPQRIARGPFEHAADPQQHRKTVTERWPAAQYDKRGPLFGDTRDAPGWLIQHPDIETVRLQTSA